jgi:hypothetical protein
VVQGVQYFGLKPTSVVARIVGINTLYYPLLFATLCMADSNQSPFDYGYTIKREDTPQVYNVSMYNVLLSLEDITMLEKYHDH